MFSKDTVDWYCPSCKAAVSYVKSIPTSWDVYFHPWLYLDCPECGREKGPNNKKEKTKNE